MSFGGRLLRVRWGSRALSILWHRRSVTAVKRVTTSLWRVDEGLWRGEYHDRVADGAYLAGHLEWDEDEGVVDGRKGREGAL